MGEKRPTIITLYIEESGTNLSVIASDSFAGFIEEIAYSFPCPAH
jgi:hypothetical protein